MIDRVELLINSLTPAEIACLLKAANKHFEPKPDDHDGRAYWWQESIRADLEG